MLDETSTFSWTILVIHPSFKAVYMNEEASERSHIEIFGLLHFYVVQLQEPITSNFNRFRMELVLVQAVPLPAKYSRRRSASRTLYSIQIPLLHIRLNLEISKYGKGLK